MNILSEYNKVSNFECALCEYTGSKYAVAVDCCTNALLLCFAYLKPEKITLPTNTFIGVANAAYHARCRINFKDFYWSGVYKIDPLNVYDSARRFTSQMYIEDSYMCVSFHYKKHLKIGRGGAILLQDKDAYEWFISARNNTKDISKPLTENNYQFPGYNMLLAPDLALKGYELLQKLPKNNPDLPDEYYGNLEKQIKWDF